MQAARQLLDGLQAGHGRRRLPSRVHRDRLRDRTGPTGAAAERLAAAQTDYAEYVTAQASLLAGTSQFADAYAAGDDDAARALYAPTRAHWERIEPVAESFGDLDPLLDRARPTSRRASSGAAGTWSRRTCGRPAGPTPGRRTCHSPRPNALRRRPDGRHRSAARPGDGRLRVPAVQIANGAKELLDEVATGKVTGEEEAWSHTDLWDFQANVEAPRVAFDVLRPIALEADPDLVATLDARFGDLLDLLAEHGSLDSGFSGYDELTTGEITALAAAVDAVAEPLSTLAATVAQA